MQTASAETEMQTERNEKRKTINEKRNGIDGKRWDDWNANEPQTERKRSVNETQRTRK